jgi:hypothetical protein
LAAWPSFLEKPLFLRGGGSLIFAKLLFF